MPESHTQQEQLHFIAQVIEKDLAARPQLKLKLRFPPEPNGYLHLGHAKALCLNFDLAHQYQGSCHLRIDDTDPSKESSDYVRAIFEDIQWLGYSTEDTSYASDYFDQLYHYATELIGMDRAYVDGHSSEAFARQYKGTPTQAGTHSPHRARSIEENLSLFGDMKAGQHPAGSLILRAKIDMSSPNMHMRDPAIYRIKLEQHYRSERKWCIYPMYDFAHCLCDAIEGVTHSLCSLEFEVHRPLYEWFLDTLGLSGPKQIEFARLSLSHTVLSKRKLSILISKGYASSWDDPMLPTLSGLRNRGFSSASLRRFVNRSGISKRNSLIDISLLNWALREDLNLSAPRRMAILRPLKVCIENYPEHEKEWLVAQNNPENAQAGHRHILFSRELYIEQTDFLLDPPSKFFRLAPGKEVRLKYAYIIRCKEVIRNEDGQITCLLCEYDPLTKSGTAGAQRSVKGTLSWVSTQGACTAELRHYEPLFKQPNPEVDPNYLDQVDPSAVERIQGAQLEASLGTAASPQEVYQFERQGYYCRDQQDVHLFHRSVSLRDSYQKASESELKVKKSKS